MAIEGVAQPLFIQIHDDLRLRRFDGTADFAFAWYQDEELVYLVEGVRKAYDRRACTAIWTATGSCISSKPGRMAHGAPSGT